MRQFGYWQELKRDARSTKYKKYVLKFPDSNSYIAIDTSVGLGW